MRSVCLCNSNIPWGGGEVWHFHAARALAARGWRVFLVCHPQGELYARTVKEEGIECVPLALSRLSFLNPFLHARMTAFFKKRGFRAVIMNLPSDLKALGPAARAAGVRHVILRRGSALPVRNSALNRWLYGRVITRLIVNSSATLEQTLSNNAQLLPKGRVSILPNGFDVEAFDRSLAAAQAARPLARPFTLGTAGRLNKQKAQHLLLELGGLLAAKGLDFRLLIAGCGEREAELKALASDLGLADRTRFTGFMADLGPFWADTDLFVLPSLWEGFGNVVIEAGLAGKAVFAFAVSNLPDLIKDGVNGRLFPLPAKERPNCPDYDNSAQEGRAGSLPDTALEDMAAAVLHLAAHADEAKAMGRAGREMALAYSQESCMDKLEQIIA